MAEDAMLLHGGTEKHYVILNAYFSDQKKWKGFDFGSKMLVTVKTYSEPGKEAHIFSIYRLENISRMVIRKGFVLPCNSFGYKRLLELLCNFLSPSLLIRLQNNPFHAA